MNVELLPLLIAHLLIILYTRVKFQQSTLNTLGVMGWTRISDGRTNRRTQNNIPLPSAGDNKSESLKLVILGLAALKIMCFNRGPYIAFSLEIMLLGIWVPMMLPVV